MDDPSRHRLTFLSYNEQSGQPYKLDIRNAPIAEEGADANTAMASLANTLRAVSPSQSSLKHKLTHHSKRLHQNAQTPIVEEETCETPFLCRHHRCKKLLQMSNIRFPRELPRCRSCHLPSQLFREVNRCTVPGLEMIQQCQTMSLFDQRSPATLLVLKLGTRK